MFEIEEAVERVIAGPEKKTRVISEEEKRIIAFHESGHALLSYVLPHTDPIHKMSIISRGRALGYVITLPEEDRFLKSKSELLDNITQLLGGRVSEEMNFSDITSGAQNDLERATKITRKMITEYGMSEKLGPVTFKGEEDEVFLGKEIASRPHYSDSIASAIDEETHNIITTSYEKARKILEENKPILSRLAKELMEKETLSRDEILKILAKVETKKVIKVKKVANKKKAAAAAGSSIAKSATKTRTIKVTRTKLKKK